MLRLRCACSSSGLAPRCPCSDPEPRLRCACRLEPAADEPPADAAGGWSPPPPAADCCCPALLPVLLPLAALAIECCRRTTPGTLTYTSGSSSFCIGVGSGEVQVGEKLPMSV